MDPYLVGQFLRAFLLIAGGGQAVGLRQTLVVLGFVQTRCNGDQQAPAARSWCQEQNN